MADDFSAPRIVSRHGLLGAQISSYRGWTGRYSFTFVADVLALIGPATTPFVPSVILTLWFAATVWCVAGLRSFAARLSWSRVILFAAFLILATLETAPNVVQSLYWQTAALTHVTPFIPVSLYVGLISRVVSKTHNAFWYRLNVLIAGTVTFIAGGFSDAYAVMQSCAFVVCLITMETLGVADFKRRIRPFLIAGLVGSVFALMIVAAAPGNNIRQSYFPNRLGIWTILGRTLWYSAGFIAKLMLTHPFVCLASLLLPFLIVMRDVTQVRAAAWDRRLYIGLLLITPALVLLLIMSCTALGLYAMSVMLPERARILLSFVFVCGTLLWSRAAGEYWASKLVKSSPKFRQNISFVATLSLLLLTVFPLNSFFSILSLRDEARVYAADWDRQDSLLKTAKQNGVIDIEVPQIGDFQSRIGKGSSDLHLRTDPTFWINRVTANYYELGSVRASESVSASR